MAKARIRTPIKRCVDANGSTSSTTGANGRSNGECASLVPFLKWAGGKRWFVDRYRSLLDTEFSRYIEPFLGSGAVYFKLAPERAILSDRNADLICTYRAIRDDWRTVYRHLKRHQRNHNRAYYYDVRSMSPRSLAGQAARFIYLNRTCWNGLYRVNLRGEFNVPVGTKTNVLLDTDAFEHTAAMLAKTEILACDFQETIERSMKGDLVFIDPPYTIQHNNNGFIKYNEGLFSWDDQVRLRDSVLAAHSRGAKLIITNALHKSITTLYSGFGEHIVARRSSVIAGNSSSRGQYKELVIKCF